MRRLIPLFVLTFMTAFAAVAQTPAANTAPLPDISAIETHMNSVSTMEARFTQTANDGQTATGKFFLKRPGRMRFEYDAPFTDFIVADGKFIYYYDGKMKEQSSTLISRSLADFFLRKDLRFAGDVEVETYARSAPNTLEVTLVQTKDPLAGSLTLVFAENPMQLQKWRILDAQGYVTEVALSNTQTGIKLKDSLFHYYDPKRSKPSTNR